MCVSAHSQLQTNSGDYPKVDWACRTFLAGRIAPELSSPETSDCPSDDPTTQPRLLDAHTTLADS